jgi:hypothetical protein
MYLKSLALEIQMTDFEAWWHLEGSTPPLPGEDGEEHCKRMCQIAWSNGAYKAREASESLLDEAKLLADDRPVEIGHLPQWTLDAEHMLRRLVKALNSASQPAQQDSTCNKTLLAQGKAYPRTCAKCGKGPCIADRVQPAQQEPAWRTDGGIPRFKPAQRTWVGLTDEEIAQGNKESWVTEQAWQSAVWWAEAKLKERNQ